VRRYIQDSVEDVIANHMLEKKREKTVEVSASKDELKFSWK